MSRGGTFVIPVLLLLLSGLLFAEMPTGFNYDGAVLKDRKGPCEYYEKSDGTHILKCPDHEQAQLPDGTAIKAYPDGKREIRSAEGTILIIDYDGTRTYRYPDGKEKIVSLDGKTPYGMSIEPVEETIELKGAVLIIRYNGMKSDDILDGNPRKLWDELIARARGKIGKVSPTKVFQRRIELSQCRFSRTGYCRRMKRDGIKFDFYRATILYKNISVPLSELRRPESRDKIIDTVIDTAFSD